MKYQQWNIAQRSQETCQTMERQGVPLSGCCHPLCPGYDRPEPGQGPPFQRRGPIARSLLTQGYGPGRGAHRPGPCCATEKRWQSMGTMTWTASPPPACSPTTCGTREGRVLLYPQPPVRRLWGEPGGGGPPYPGRGSPSSSPWTAASPPWKRWSTPRNWASTW